MLNYATADGNSEVKIELEEFIKLFNQKKAILLDIRMEYEHKIFTLPFALSIPANKLSQNLNKLPKDKIIVVACPTQNRSPFATMYLIQNGFSAKYLENGLLNLIASLKGKNAKKLILE